VAVDRNVLTDTRRCRVNHHIDVSVVSDGRNKYLGVDVITDADATGRGRCDVRLDVFPLNAEDFTALHTRFHRYKTPYRASGLRGLQIGSTFDNPIRTA
jgi:hypothetical protein